MTCPNVHGPVANLLYSLWFRGRVVRATKHIEDSQEQLIGHGRPTHGVQLSARAPPWRVFHPWYMAPSRPLLEILCSLEKYGWH